MKHIDHIALSGMAIGIISIFQPWWSGGLKLGFFLTLVFTILHIITSHRKSSEAGDE